MSKSSPPSSPRAAHPIPTWVFPAILVVIAAAVYGQVCGFDFLDWDDTVNVFQNPYLHPVNAEHLLRFWRASYFELYTPMMYTFWSLCGWIAEPTEPIPGRANFSASVFHAGSLLLHLANIVLVWALLRLLVERIVRSGDCSAEEPNPNRSNFAATAGTALFALHPLQVESIGWITGGNNLLSGTFGIAALLTYLSIRTPGMWAERRPRLGYGLATVLYILALLSKPTAVTIALIALAMEWGTAPLDERRRFFAPKRLLPMGVWVLLGGVDGVITKMSSPQSQSVYLPVWGRPFIAGDAIAFYLYKLLLPLQIGTDYGRKPTLVLGNWWGYADFAATIVLGLLIWRSRNRILQTGALVSLSALLPMLGFVAYYFHRWSTVGDHYIYLAIIGPALVIAGLWRCWDISNPRLGFLMGALYGVLVIFWAARATLQTATWYNSRTVFEQTLTINPQSVIALFKLGSELEREGDPDEAEKVYRNCVKLAPDYPMAHYNLGSLLARRGQLDEGIAELREALRLDNDYAEAHNNLGLALEQKGQWTEAVAEFQESLRVNPDYAPAQGNLTAAQQQVATDPNRVLHIPPEADPEAARVNADGVSLARAGKFADAAIAFRRAIRSRPDDARAFYNLGRALAQADDLEGAVKAYRSALLRQPTYAEAHFNLGVALARQGDAKGADAELKEAIRLKPNWPAARQALATLEQATGNGTSPP